MFKNLSKILRVIGKKNLLILITLIPMGIFSVFLEIFSIASFLPLMQQGFGGGNISSNDSISKIAETLVNYFDNFNYLLIFALSIIIVKNIFLLFQNYYALTITKKIYLFISDKFFISRMSEEYLSFIKNSSASFIKDLRETTINFKVYLDAQIQFFIEITMAAVITIFLLFLNFKVTAVIFLFFGTFVILFSIFSKNFSQRIGKKQNKAAEVINNTLINSYHNFVDMKLYRENKFFQKIYTTANEVYAEYSKKMFFIFSIPKSALELSIVIFLIVFFIYFREIEYREHIGIFSIYLVAIYRLLPSATRLSHIKMQLNSQSFAINIIYNAIKNNSEKRKKLKKIKSRIEFKNVSFSYDKKNMILKNKNFIFKKNNITCLYGKSGSGKTTLVKLIAGLIEPNMGGKIILDNKFHYKNLYLNIAYVSQNFFIMKDTLANNIVFNDNEKINLKKIDLIMNMLELSSVMKNKKMNYNSMLTEDASFFSGGQRQRIAIARALYRDTEVVIFDESTNALDLKTEKKIIKNLHQIKLNKIIIIISHRKETRKNCDASYDLS